MVPPSRDCAGHILCPRCGTRLNKERAPFKVHGEYLGKFESLVCPICNYSVLTGEGYDQAIAEATKFGLVGPAQEEEILEIVTKPLELSPIEVSMNTTNLESKNEVGAVGAKFNEPQILVQNVSFISAKQFNMPSAKA